MYAKVLRPRNTHGSINVTCKTHCSLNSCGRKISAVLLHVSFMHVDVFVGFYMSGVCTKSDKLCIVDNHFEPINLV